MAELEPRTGALLVASPSLLDANFAQTVVLLVDHDSDGTLGLILNRPTEVAVASALPRLTAAVGDEAVIFSGGPVAPDHAIAVGSRAPGLREPDWFRGVLGQVGLVDVDALEEDRASVEEVRIYAGYAGWGAGQLEWEISEGAWFVVGATPADLRSPSPLTLWRTVLRRQPAPLAFASTWTPEYEWN